jgi:hypothetical protein
MKNVNIRLFWYFLSFILIVGTIIYWIKINNNLSSNSKLEQKINIEKLNNSNNDEEILNVIKNDQEVKIIPDTTLTSEETELLKIKTNFNTFCTQITSNEKIKELLVEWQIILDDSIKSKIIAYINNEINLTDLENILLETIWETDWTELLEQRLYLNYIFLVLNDIKRWNITECSKVFTQYYK